MKIFTHKVCSEQFYSLKTPIIQPQIPPITGYYFNIRKTVLYFPQMTSKDLPALTSSVSFTRRICSRRSCRSLNVDCAVMEYTRAKPCPFFMYRSLIAVNCSCRTTETPDHQKSAANINQNRLWVCCCLLFRLCPGFQACTAAHQSPLAVQQEKKKKSFNRL